MKAICPNTDTAVSSVSPGSALGQALLAEQTDRGTKTDQHYAGMTRAERKRLVNKVRLCRPNHFYSTAIICRNMAGVLNGTLKLSKTATQFYTRLSSLEVRHTPPGVAPRSSKKGLQAFLEFDLLATPLRSWVPGKAGRTGPRVHGWRGFGKELVMDAFWCSILHRDRWVFMSGPLCVPGLVRMRLFMIYRCRLCRRVRERVKTHWFKPQRY
jgi:hypothetical protein